MKMLEDKIKLIRLNEVTMTSARRLSDEPSLTSSQVAIDWEGNRCVKDNLASRNF